jgi:cytoskeletal protein RodZ
MMNVELKKDSCTHHSSFNSGRAEKEQTEKRQQEKLTKVKIKIMKKTLRTKSSNIQIISFMVILGLFVFSMSGCQQVNDMVNGNKATNSNTTANANANSNANSNMTANSNANANTSASPTNSAANANTQASNTAANIATTTKDGVPLTAEEKVFANNLIGAWSDDKEKVVFSKDEVKFYNLNGTTPNLTWKYTIVDEKNVEITDEGGQKSTAMMTFEENNTKLHWVDKMGDFRYKREANKP